MKTKSSLCIFLCCFIFLVSFTSNIARASDNDKSDNDKSDNTFSPRIEVKLNSLIALGIINPAVEFKVFDKGTVQLETVGIFYPKGFLNNHNPPLTFVGSWLEFHYYFSKAFYGFYVGANIGIASYRMSKNEVYWSSRSIQVGSASMLGATIGYNLKLSKQWGIDFYCSPGWQNSVYEGYNVATGVRYIGINKSGEWLPAYKGGISLAFKF